MVSPLLKPMHTELYNEKWMQPRGNKLSTQSRHDRLPSSEIDALVFKSHTVTSIPTMIELHNGPRSIPQD